MERRAGRKYLLPYLLRKCRPHSAPNSLKAHCVSITETNWLILHTEIHIIPTIWSRVSSVGIATGYGLDNLGSIPARSKRFFSTPHRIGRLWGPSSLLCNGYQGIKRLRHEADQSPPSTEEVKLDLHSPYDFTERCSGTTSIYEYLSTALQSLVGPWLLFSFSIFYTVSRTPWTGDQPVARPLPAHKGQHKQNKRTQTSMPQVRFEPTIPVFVRAKTVPALDRAATVIG
jgi:hypothetical protein